MGQPYAGHPVHQRCALDPEMSTSGRGSILPAERANITGGETIVEDMAGIAGRNAFEFGSDCQSDAGGDPANSSGSGRTE